MTKLEERRERIKDPEKKIEENSKAKDMVNDAYAEMKLSKAEIQSQIEEKQKLADEYFEKYQALWSNREEAISGLERKYKSGGEARLEKFNILMKEMETAAHEYAKKGKALNNEIEELRSKL